MDYSDDIRNNSRRYLYALKDISERFDWCDPYNGTDFYIECIDDMMVAMVDVEYGKPCEICKKTLFALKSMKWSYTSCALDARTCEKMRIRDENSALEALIELEHFVDGE
jgi:hypothetical protein